MTFDELLNLVSSGKAPGICVDSRLVNDGDIFVAVKGTVYDGHDFIDKAVANGAKYVVCRHINTQYAIHNTQYEFIVVDDSAIAAAILAQASRGCPAAKLTNLAVTGTNGKTTVAYLVRSVIREAGEKCGLIGTIVYDTGLDSDKADLTTPDSLLIADAQKKMVEAGAKYMVIEASSHALSQNRLTGIKFKAAAFTNIAGDHLDYHKTKADYLAAKTKLFTSLSPDAVAVLNKQSPEAEIIAGKTSAKILWYAIDEPADLTAHIESMDITGTVFTLGYAGQSSIVKTSLTGRYNVSNHLAAAGLCLAAGFELEAVAAGLSALQGVPGRLEKVEYSGVGVRGSGIRNQVASDQRRATSHVLVGRVGFSPPSRTNEKGPSGPAVFVDFAHTDDALEKALSALKPFCKGSLYVVFGCGGDRDRTKRPRMARVAEQLADFVIVTSDNPRTEKPQAIIDEIITGFEKGPVRDASCVMRRAKNGRNTQYAIRNTKIVEPDRRKAIELAINTAGKDDIVLIAGKGHEDYQIIGKQKFAFSDKAEALKSLRKRI